MSRKKTQTEQSVNSFTIEERLSWPRWTSAENIQLLLVFGSFSRYMLRELPLWVGYSFQASSPRSLHLVGGGLALIGTPVKSQQRWWKERDMETHTGPKNESAPSHRKAVSALALQGWRQKRGNVHMSALDRVLAHKLSHLTGLTQWQRAGTMSKSQLVHIRETWDLSQRQLGEMERERQLGTVMRPIGKKRGKCWEGNEIPEKIFAQATPSLRRYPKPWEPGFGSGCPGNSS